jgi:alpha-L-fucosidase
VKSVKLLRSGAPVKVEQDEFRTRFMGLPATPPDSPVTTIAVECDGEPMQDTDFVRKNRERDHV